VSPSGWGVRINIKRFERRAVARVAETAWRGRTTPRLKVTCKITDLVFLVDWAVALRRMILDLGVNVEGSPVERDR
jgi:hypothetical protein